jgi:hypothetical protein
MTEPTVRHATAHRRRLLAGPLAVAVVLAALVLVAPAVSAHGDDARIEEVQVAQSGTSATITVKMTYTNDAEAVTDATLTVAGDTASGAKLDPVPMQATSPAGEYTATVDLPAPGTWNLRVTSADPTATLELTREVAAAPEVTASAATASTASTTTTTGPGATGVPELKSTPDQAGQDDDSGTSPIWWVLGGVVVVVALGLGAVFVFRGRDQGPIE